jgi:hypothetical protein
MSRAGLDFPPALDSMKTMSATDRRLPLPSWLWWVLPMAVGAGLRLWQLGQLDAFVDESALILTALDERVKAVMDPIAQGRPALLWLFAPAGWFPGHALEAGRLMSALAGLGTIAALGWALHQAAGRAAARCAMWLWALMPFAVLHERLALQDPFITALLAGAVALMVRGSRHEQAALGWWAGAGAAFGVACLFKISAVLSLPWLGLLYLASQKEAGRPILSRRLAAIAGGAVVPLLLLGSGLGRLGGASVQAGFLPSTTGGTYWSQAAERFALWPAWIAGYGGWPLWLLLFGALPLLARKPSRLGSAAAAGAALALVVATLVHNRPFARYILPDQVPLVLFLGLAWGSALSAPGRWRTLVAAPLALAAGGWALASGRIAIDPARAPIPPGEADQYFTGPWSGQGLRAVRQFLTAYADEHRVTCVVLTHRYFRPGAYGLMLDALADARIAVVPITVYEPEELAAAQKAVRRAVGSQPATVFILYEGSLYPPHPWLDAPASPAQAVLKVPHGARDEFTLYQVRP